MSDLPPVGPGVSRPGPAADRSATWTARSRVVTWVDPGEARAAGDGLGHRERLAAIAAGRLPFAPVAALLGQRLVEVGEGTVTFEMTPDESHLNSAGVVHGGIVGALCDSALGNAVLAALPDEAGYTTLEYKVNLVRPLRADGRAARCEARVLHVGRRTATATASVVDADGRLVAHATTTCAVLSDR